MRPSPPRKSLFRDFSNRFLNRTLAAAHVARAHFRDVAFGAAMNLDIARTHNRYLGTACAGRPDLARALHGDFAGRVGQALGVGTPRTTPEEQPGEKERDQ